MCRAYLALVLERFVLEKEHDAIPLHLSVHTACERLISVYNVSSMAMMAIRHVVVRQMREYFRSPYKQLCRCKAPVLKMSDQVVVDAYCNYRGSVQWTSENFETLIENENVRQECELQDTDILMSLVEHTPDAWLTLTKMIRLGLGFDAIRQWLYYLGFVNIEIRSIGPVSTRHMSQALYHIDFATERDTDRVARVYADDGRQASIFAHVTHPVQSRMFPGVLPEDENLCELWPHSSSCYQSTRAPLEDKMVHEFTQKLVLRARSLMSASSADAFSSRSGVMFEPFDVQLEMLEWARAVEHNGGLSMQRAAAMRKKVDPYDLMLGLRQQMGNWNVDYDDTVDIFPHLGVYSTRVSASRLICPAEAWISMPVGSGKTLASAMLARVPPEQTRTKGAEPGNGPFAGCSVTVILTPLHLVEQWWAELATNFEWGAGSDTEAPHGFVGAPSLRISASAREPRLWCLNHVSKINQRRVGGKQRMLSDDPVPWYELRPKPVVQKQHHVILAPASPAWSLQLWMTLMGAGFQCFRLIVDESHEARCEHVLHQLRRYPNPRCWIYHVTATPQKHHLSLGYGIDHDHMLREYYSYHEMFFMGRVFAPRVEPHRPRVVEEILIPPGPNELRVRQSMLCMFGLDTLQSLAFTTTHIQPHNARMMSDVMLQTGGVMHASLLGDVVASAMFEQQQPEALPPLHAAAAAAMVPRTLDQWLQAGARVPTEERQAWVSRDDECFMCFESVSQRIPVQFSCGHAVCRTCAEAWVAVVHGLSCGLCRVPVTYMCEQVLYRGEDGSVGDARKKPRVSEDGPVVAASPTGMSQRELMDAIALRTLNRDHIGQCVANAEHDGGDWILMDGHTNEVRRQVRRFFFASSSSSSSAVVAAGVSGRRLVVYISHMSVGLVLREVLRQEGLTDDDIVWHGRTLSSGGGRRGGRSAEVAGVGAFRRGRGRVLILHTNQNSGHDLFDASEMWILSPLLNRTQMDQAVGRLTRNGHSREPVIVKVFVVANSFSHYLWLNLCSDSKVRSVPAGLTMLRKYAVSLNADIKRVYETLREVYKTKPACRQKWWPTLREWPSESDFVVPANKNLVHYTGVFKVWFDFQRVQVGHWRVVQRPPMSDFDEFLRVVVTELESDV